MKSVGYLGWLDLPFGPHVPFPTSDQSSALVTAGVLTAGLISFRQGNSQLGQKLMRARVVVQGATVALMVGTAFYYGENPWRSS
ncbi:RING-H2 finger protein ATL48 [Glycine soja]